MPIPNTRNLPAEVHARLRLRAARAHRSMEAEARAILAEICLGEIERRPASDLSDWVERLYGGRKPMGVVEEFIAERRREAERE